MDEFGGEATGLTGRGGGVEIPAESVCAVIVENVPGINDIAKRFRHFLALAIENMAQRKDIFEADLIVEQGADGMERIEPATGLIDGFTNIVSGILIFEFFFILKGVMPLCVRHGARIEPNIN